MQLRCRRGKDGPDRPGCAPLLSDDLSQVVFRYPQLVNRGLVPFDLVDDDIVGMVHKDFVINSTSSFIGFRSV